MKISYNWLKWYIPDAPTPEKLEEVFTFHLCEVEGVEKFQPLSPNGQLPLAGEQDWIFDIKILPDRASYLLSHHGIAKELSGLLGIKYNDPTPLYKIPASIPTELVVNAEGARRYMGRIVRNIKVGPSPEWVVKHLESIGQRSINNIVDATNIVMYDCGQPCHAFDLDKITGKISVRKAQDGEEITTLDNKQVKLIPDDFVIADDTNILALAGVKGGKIAEVDSNTTNIVLEVANFFPVSVRKTARRAGIFTDSAKRFENNLSPELCEFAMTELSGLIIEMCPEALFEDVVDEYSFDGFKSVRTLSFRAEKISRILGLPVQPDQIETILKNYQIEIISRTDDVFEIVVPKLRFDLEREEDMVEEIGRVLGYDKVVPRIPTIDFKPRINETTFKILSIRKKLLSEGYNEVMTYSFGEKGKVSVMQSAEDKNFLRENLKDGLAESLTKNTLNAPLLGIDTVKIFEIGTVFTKDAEQINIAYNEKKNIVEMSLDEYCVKNNIVVGDSYGDLLQSATGSTVPAFAPWSSYPFISRDVAVWVPESISSDVLKQIYQKNGTELLVREPRLVDTFTKEGKTSYAFRLVFQSFERTLTDADVNKIMEAIYEKLKENADWELR